ncbi:hypothetical protein ASJ78_01334 [Serratia marcescens]|nr:hypothetical protein ASJ78_01334 [Serratia marcescens]
MQKQTRYFLKSIVIQSIFNLNIIFLIKLNMLSVVLACVDIVGYPGNGLYWQAV